MVSSIGLYHWTLHAIQERHFNIFSNNFPRHDDKESGRQGLACLVLSVLGICMITLNFP